MATQKQDRTQETKETEQYIENQSFDETFNVQAIEGLGYDSDNNVLRRIAVDETGQLKITSS